MKLPYVLIFLSVFLQAASGETLEEGMKRQLAETKANPTKENLIGLAVEIGRNYRHEFNLLPGALTATNEARKELCRIPGHAQYLADEIERVRKSIDLPSRFGGSNYNLLRHSYIVRTLPHFPSPETVLILGRFLDDDRDATPPSEISDAIPIPANSILGARALTEIGLRHAPIKPPFVEMPDQLDIWRTWWEEVKSGRKPFSFIGQKVEYRFKPDGTWETLPIANPPDDAPGRREAGAADRPVKRPQATLLLEKQAPQGSSWAWIIGALIAALGGVFWLGMRKVPR